MSIIFSIFKEKNTMENFKQIPGYENYGISPAGEVKNLKTGNIRKPFLAKNGYMLINVWGDGRRKRYYVHQLVAQVYLNHVPCGFNVVIDHINGDKHDNRLENLQLISHRENSSKDKFKIKKSGLPIGVFKGYKNTYRSQISINGKITHIGKFNTIEEASNAYQQKLKQIT